MPYALSNLVNGEQPSARYIANTTDAMAGEVVLGDAEYESKQGWVWDATNKVLRAPSDADRLRWAKRDKRHEGSRRMHVENEALFPEVRGVEGAWVAEALVEMISDPRGPRVGAIKSNRDKRARFHVAVDGKTTVTEVQAVTWEGA